MGISVSLSTSRAREARIHSATGTGDAPSTIRRIWRAFGRQPHRSETFKLSNDPLFAALDIAIGAVIGAHAGPGTLGLAYSASD